MKLVKQLLGLETRRDRWQAENYPIRKLISLIIMEGLASGADCISFGTPADDLEKIPLTGPAPSNECDAQVDKRLNALESELKAVGALPNPIFFRDCEASVPLWQRVGHKWQQIEGPPIRLLHHIIAVLELMFVYDTTEDAPHGRKLLVLTGTDVHVYVELWFETDCTYTLLLEAKANEHPA